MSSMTVPIGACCCAATRSSQCTASTAPQTTVSTGRLGRGGRAPVRQHTTSSPSPMPAAPSQQRAATMPTADRSIWRTIRPMKPHVVAIAASANAASEELDRDATGRA
jgi:hypothetical protein